MREKLLDAAAGAVVCIVMTGLVAMAVAYWTGVADSEIVAARQSVLGF